MKKWIFAFGISLILGACANPNPSGTQAISDGSLMSNESTGISGSESGNTQESVARSEAQNAEQSVIQNEASNQSSESPSETGAYQELDQFEAIALMMEQTNWILLDVRTPQEFASGHIPDAINLPNEDITNQEPDILPDKDQLILVYCRSGNRSGQAAKKLAAMGYTTVFNIGGVNTWPGDLVQ